MTTQSHFFTPENVVTRRADGSLSVTWNNGHALNAVTGAAVDYIPAHYRLAGVLNDGRFEPRLNGDIARMMGGGVSARLAYIVAMLRKIVQSMDSASVNLTECWVLDDGDLKANIPQADWDALVQNAEAVRGILNQALTILGLNGVSMLLKGHNWIEADNMWSRLEAATSLASHFETLGVADWEAAVYHHAFHPFALGWKSQLVVREDTPLTGHINGVLVKRMPAVPAGTSLIFVALAAIQDLVVARPACEAVLAPLGTRLVALRDRIKSEPLNWCIHFTTTRTAQNLAVVAQLEKSCAFLYGMSSTLFERRSTIVKAAAFKANASRHPAQTSLGKTYAESLEDEDVNVVAITAMIRGSSDANEALMDDLPEAVVEPYQFVQGNVAHEADDEDAHALAEARTRAHGQAPQEGAAADAGDGN